MQQLTNEVGPKGINRMYQNIVSNIPNQSGLRGVVRTREYQFGAPDLFHELYDLATAP